MASSDEKHVSSDDKNMSLQNVESTDVGHVENANAATTKEHNLTLIRGLKAYPRAIMWSILLSSAVIMEGYDTSMIGSFLAFPSFLNTFSNTAADDGTLEIVRR